MPDCSSHCPCKPSAHWLCLTYHFLCRLIESVCCLSSHSPLQPSQVTFPWCVKPSRSQQNSGRLTVHSKHPQGQTTCIRVIPLHSNTTSRKKHCVLLLGCFLEIKAANSLISHLKMCSNTQISHLLSERAAAQRKKNCIPQLRLSCEKSRIPRQCSEAFGLSCYLQVSSFAYCWNAGWGKGDRGKSLVGTFFQNL